MWQVWWVWVAGGFLLAGLEVLAPGFIFLGFALGAVATGLIVATGLVTGFAALMLVFAILSGLAWLGLRAAFSSGAGQVKRWDRDINDNGP